MNRKLIAIVPAGGVGQRAEAGLPKQYQSIAGKPMLWHAVQALLADTRISQVRVATAPDDAYVANALAGSLRTVWRPCGGPTRAHTVLGALDDALTQGSLADNDWVLVHDAARPALPATALARLIDTCLARDTGGLLALPVADSVKQAVQTDASDRTQTPPGSEEAVPVARSVPRDGLWLAQTPQMFRAGQLRRALEQGLQAGLALTDESSAMERTGCQPLLVTGAASNFKVTWPEDFDRVAGYLDPTHLSGSAAHHTACDPGNPPQEQDTPS